MRYIYVLLLILISCKNEVSTKKSNKNKLTENIFIDSSLNKVSSKKRISVKQNIENCELKLKKFVLSTSIKSPFFNSLEAKVEDIEKTKLKIQLFIKSTDGVNKETTVGWLIFDAENKKLLDITNDIDDPEILSYDDELWNELVMCYFDNDDNNKYLTSKVSIIEWNCIDKGGDMNDGYVTNCISKINLKDTYFQLRQKYFEDGNLLLDIIPKKDTVYIKEDIEIKYKILNQKKINVILTYPGGLTKFELIENKEKTNIIKTMYPD